MQLSSDFSEDTQKQQATRMTLSEVTLLESKITAADPGVLESSPVPQQTPDGPGAASTGWRGWSQRYDVRSPSILLRTWPCSS